MSSTDLVPTNGDIAGSAPTTQALIQLNEAAERAATPEEAREIMVKARAISEVLYSARAPLRDSCLAGKASVVAARRLGLQLASLSSKAGPRTDGRPGRAISDRGLVIRELGLSRPSATELIRLSEAPDPEFQRYIQSYARIPSVAGALRSCRPGLVKSGGKGAHWEHQRRKRVGVRTPNNPSLDEGYSLIVRALGHIATTPGRGGLGNQQKRTDIRKAIDHLYAAEDLLKPYRGGYVR